MEVIVKQEKSKTENAKNPIEKTPGECGGNVPYSENGENAVKDVTGEVLVDSDKTNDDSALPFAHYPAKEPSRQNVVENGMYSERIFKDEEKSQTTGNVCGKESVFVKDSPADKASVIFGQSEDEMRREFRAFKAAKLFKKFDCDLTEICSPEMLDQKLLEAKNFGFGAVVVTPQKIKIARERLKGSGIEVVAAVCFPTGEECFGVKKYAVKKAVAFGADRIYVPVGISAIKFGAIDKVKREFRSIVKVAKKKKVSAVLESGILTAQETERAVRILNGAKVMSFVSSSGKIGMSEGISAVKNIRYFLKSGSEVCGFTASRKSDEAVGLMSVADRLFVRNAAELAADIRANLKY